MATRIALALVVLSGCGYELNARVLELVATYEPGSSGGYEWPSADGSDGTTMDLVLGSDTIARAGRGNHCVGMTFEVFWRALSQCPGGVERALDPGAARRMLATWYVPEAGGAGPAAALPDHDLGVRIADLEDARPGDFVQAWTGDESLGHSMVFLSWTRDDTGRIAGLRYWSSQPWTDGIGESSAEIGDGEGAFDPDRLHVARARCPAG